MGYKYDRDDLLAAAVEFVLGEGFARLTFGRLARRIGINDRSIVYYFPTKAELVGAVAEQLGAGFQSVLDAAFADDELNALDIAGRAWPMLAAPETDPVFRLYFELVGLSASSTTPYEGLAEGLIGDWVDWLAERAAGDDPDDKRATALAAVAIVDGLLLVRHTLGADDADAAADALGIGRNAG